jgi:hypothetical protein
MDEESTAMRRRILATGSALLLCATAAYAHVGSPDIYADGQTGSYHLSVVVRPPVVIPGVAEIDVRAQTSGIDRITITPVPLTGEAAKHPPVPDTMQQPSRDPQFFTGHLWIMAPGSWQIRFAVNGKQGSGTLAIPLPAIATATQTMQPALGTMLAILGILLVFGMVGIVGAATREAKLPPGAAIPTVDEHRGHVAMSMALAILVAAVILGNHWWRVDAAVYAKGIYKPMQMNPVLVRGNLLDLKLRDSGWLTENQLDDFIPDHDHLMHLYMIRWPQMDIIFHLHPEPVATGEFQLALPSMPAGDYHLYADVVHADGFPETLVAALLLPQNVSGRPLAGDDAEGIAKPLDASGYDSVSGTASGPREERFLLPDGYTMVWKMPGTLIPKAPESFRFELLDPEGNPPSDMALYMGMLGHAAFVKTDETVFAHVHPTGTMAMAAFMMANHQDVGKGMEMAKMPGMDMDSGSLPNVVSFPYGFPSGGRYRIIVQMKHGSTVETGVFDADVRNQ